ncbi:MAG: polyribonucleotide nucleotidyltransferase [Anaerolineales bacterium]|nr:MAG: polyribonucleotide nucleotidyltransferase [Anaerolineales bacterium]
MGQNIQTHRFEARVADRDIIFETGKLAGQAGGAVVARVGDSLVLATATASRQPREGVDFFPLTVDYEERLYAAGRIPGSFFRREGRPSEEAILLCRLTDRPLRPLFPKGFRNEVHIVLTALSSDGENQIDVLAINAASAALMISGIPFDGPVGAVRVGLIDEQLVINPTASEMEHSALDLRVAGTEDAILMVEAGANEVSEARILEALRVGHEALQALIHVQREMAAQVGKPAMEVVLAEVLEETRSAVLSRLDGRIAPMLETNRTKEEYDTALNTLRDELIQDFAEDESVAPKDVAQVLDEEFKKALRQRVLDHGIRADGRDAVTVRPISGEVGLLPRTHGSGLFSRGETQVLTITTLGTPREEQTLDTLGPNETKRYMHHYNFPPYSTGETGFMRGPKRREIGHGALAERALLPMIPEEDGFPYTLRLVSEVLSSNGSTSMGSVCASTLSLMDAGVPIKAPVSGVAMGLITQGDRYVVLTDIQGMEDALGDMDFKVAGTRQGINALQMDIKIRGLGYEILEKALAQAREGRLYILDRMLEVIDSSRPNLSPYAPRIITVQIDPEKIGKIIGPGGKTVRAIQEETGVKIDIGEDGTVFIASADGEGSQRAVQMVQALTEEAEVGRVYTGKVVRTTEFGAFVEILPGTDGLVHISQLADYRVPSVEDVVRVGDEIMVMVIDIDGEGKIRLSRQAVLEGWTAEEAREHDRRRPSGGRNRGGRNRGGRSRPRQQ